MTKKGGGRIQKKDAEAIANKLEAKRSEGSGHEQVVIYYDGHAIARYGIRRNSKVGHAHIPKQIFLSEFETIKLARCQISKSEYFEIARKKGKLPEGD